jgi:colanic acid biosynthesis glycosyl transferase WcaI
MCGALCGASTIELGMRLLVVSQYFWPENFRVNDMVRELIARGHDVTVLTGLPNYPEGAVYRDFRADPTRFSSFGGARVERVPILPRGTGSLRLALNYLSFVMSACLLGPWKLRDRRFDAIFVFQTSPVTAALPGILMRRIKHAPLLMWILDLWPDTLSAIGVVRSRTILDVVGRLVRFIYRRCDLILVQSRAFFDNVRQYGVNERQIKYFPNWPEPAFEIDPSVTDGAPELAPYRDDLKLLFAGNIGEAQDFPAILDAAERLRDQAGVRWLIVGDGRAVPWVRAEIQRRGLERQVLLLGRHPIERMPSFFLSADALLVTLRAEPIWGLTVPGKLQSYLAAGRPILAMLDGEGARVVAESRAGLVAPAGDGRKLAENVQLMMNMSARTRARMGSAGRAYCLREFDRSRLFDSLEGWFEQAIASRRTGADRRANQARE